MWQFRSTLFERASASSSGVTTREAAAIPHLPCRRASKPVAVPLDSKSTVTLGRDFLYSEMSRGANSSPMVLEPFMTMLPLVTAGESALSQAPSARASASAIPDRVFSPFEPPRIVFMEKMLIFKPRVGENSSHKRERRVGTPHAS